MPNIKFSYRYRDGANYKNHSFRIFNNSTNIALAEIKKHILLNLIDGTWFYADKWNVPDLHFGAWDNEIDHTWHEFENVEFTDEVGQRDVVAFLEAISG